MTKIKSALQDTQCAEQSSIHASLLSNYRETRHTTESLCRPLAIEDYGLQTMPDVSPPRWHIAHVSWLFETFLLQPFLQDYQPYHPQFGYLFNSYYQTVGSMHPRPERGFLSRPTTEEVFQYRKHVDEHMTALLENIPDQHHDEILLRTIVGINHEQQHQELLLSDIKYNFFCNPLKPAYIQNPPDQNFSLREQSWFEQIGGIVDIGHDNEGFSFDNEGPQHRVLLQPFRLATRLITNGEYAEFIDAGGYRQVDLWLSDAWKTVQQQDWQAPLYWQKSDGQWWYMTLAGLQVVDESEPVCHVSFFEADAYARWVGKRLPTEFEWEAIAVSQNPVQGNFLDWQYLRPITTGNDGMSQLFGDVWEWTQSAYAPYPGFKPLPGSLGEYNGKFMSSQMTLRGGSCVTPANHIRASYRNFFYPQDRWQFTGIRLAEDV